MSTELFLNFLAIKMVNRKVEDHEFAMNFVTPDNGEKFLVELRNAILTEVEGFQAASPDLTLRINRSDLEMTMAGDKTLDTQLADGKAVIEGDPSMLGVLAQAMVDFDPFFEVLPRIPDPNHVESHSDAFEAVTGLPAIELFQDTGGTFCTSEILRVRFVSSFAPRFRHGSYLRKAAAARNRYCDRSECQLGWPSASQTLHNTSRPSSPEPHHLP